MSEAKATKRGGLPSGDERPGLKSRKVAAQLLAAIVEARTPLDGLTDPETGHPAFRALDTRDRALVRAILVSALRRRQGLAAALARLTDRPLPANATALTHLLHVAAAQILLLDVPDSAAVDLAVSQAQDDPRTRRFSALVNAVLRRLAREKDAAREALPQGDAPAWFREMLDAAYPNKAAAILAMHAVAAPLDLTVKADAEDWAARLGGIMLPTGSVRLAGVDTPVRELPGYEDGAWWVQDAAAAIPALLFGRLDGRTALDLCAAPGGKTAQLAVAGAEVTALDLSANRLKRLRANLDRLGLSAETVEGDAMRFEPDRRFDAVLLDAPCSSTGTVRRHPDIPWTKGPEDVTKLAALQARLLDRAARHVAPGGRLVFSNCSLAPVEGEALVEPFLAAHPDFRIDRIGADEFAGLAPFLAPDGTLRTTPADLDLGDPARSGLDGFYAVRLRRDG